MDELKKYLQNHADELNLDEPTPRVWENIRTQSQPPVKKANVIVMITRFAAAACVLALAGIGAWHLFSGKEVAQPVITAKVETVKPQPQKIQPEAVEKQPVTAEKTEPVITAKTETHNNIKRQRSNAQSSPANREALANLLNIENSFTQVINLQRDRVNSMPMYAESPEYFKDFKLQIRQMEKDEKVIKSDIAKRGMNDELLDQLINLYQQKLNTLKQLQIEMNKTNTRYKQNRGPVDSARTYFINL